MKEVINAFQIDVFDPTRDMPAAAVSPLKESRVRYDILRYEG